MGVFKEMDPVLVRAAIEGFKDELTPDLEEQDKFYRQFSCPRCKCGLDKEFDPRVCYTGDGSIAKAILKCGSCDYRIEPHTGMIVTFGDASKTPFGLLPIIGGEPYIPDP